MEKKIYKSLLIVGAIIIALGLISGISSYDKELAKEYDMSKRVYEKLNDNPLARQDFIEAQQVYQLHLTVVMTYVISGLIGGLILLGLGAVISLLYKMNVYIKFAIEPKSKGIHNDTVS